MKNLIRTFMNIIWTFSDGKFKFNDFPQKAQDMHSQQDQMKMFAKNFVCKNKFCPKYSSKLYMS